MTESPRTILVGPFLVFHPFIIAGHVEDVANQRQTRRAGGQIIVLQLPDAIPANPYHQSDSDSSVYGGSHSDRPKVRDQGTEEAGTYVLWLLSAIQLQYYHNVTRLNS